MIELFYNPPLFFFRVLKEYEAEFQKYKPSRELTFMPNKGLVVVELDFESTDRKQTFHTTPEAAQIIQLFATKGNWFQM